MISKQTVFKKSARGIEIIADRQAGLSPKLRTVLIMVDGKRSFEDLVPMVSVLGDPQGLLAELEAAGFVEPVGAAPVNSSAKLSASAAGKTTPSGFAVQPTLDGARRFTTRLLTDLLGPMAQTLCVKIETARDIAEFIAAVKRARDIVRELKGQAAAAEFIEQIEAHMPPT
ncbi:MAG: hypothetical protein RL211_2395 [Pseudomonadota bacterium]